MVVAITTVLRGEAADWVADLYSDHARELTDIGLFLESLRARFEDDSQTQQAEGELVSLKQRGRPARDYGKDFWAIAERLRAWPERMLVHQFHLGLDRELKQACVYRGLLPRRTEWFRAAVDLDISLKEFRFKGIAGTTQPRRATDRPPTTRDSGRPSMTTGTSESTRRAPFRCFRCNQVGHRALDCPFPPLQPSTSCIPVTSGKERARTTPERSRAASQALPSESGTPTKEAGVSAGPKELPVVLGD